MLPGWQTIRTRIRILLVIHSMTAAARLADLIPIFQDPRMQLFCTQTSGSVFPHGIEPFIRNHGFYHLTWEQAKALQFDAVISASLGDNLHEIASSPVLRIPHGNGYNKRWISDQRSAISDQRSAISDQRSAISDQRSVFGLSEETLKYDGRLIPSAIGLSHTEQFTRLAEGCSDAVPRAFIAGDPCYDRILASLPRRLHYRHAFRLRPGLRLITVASTWREDSLFGLDPLLVSRMLGELSYDRYRIALLLHPNTWASHSSFQVKAWLAEALRAGLILLPPGEGWHAAVIAADWVMSDHGSLGVYAAAAGRPVLLEKSARDTVDPRSGIGRLLEVALGLDVRADIEPQLRSAEELRDRTQTVAATWISSAPGISLRLIRDELYRILNVPPPDTEPAVLAVGSPAVSGHSAISLWTSVEHAGPDSDEYAVRRWPAAVTGPSRTAVLIADDQELDHRLTGQAAIIRTTWEDLPSDEEEWSAAVFRHRPGVQVTVVYDNRQAVLRTREGGLISVILDRIDGPGEAELVFAVLAERLLASETDLPGVCRLSLRLGPDQVIRAAMRVRAH
jgi:hypothetical protein